MTTDQQLYEQWREEYALTYEPNYDEHLEADCRAAFFAGIRAARGAQMVVKDCWCTTCRPITIADMRFVVCPDCGNKRCPKAHNHTNPCTNSNATGQKGSSWEHVKPLAAAPLPPLAAPVECACGDSYPADSFGAGFIAARNKCPNCDAAEAALVQLPEPAVPYAIFDCHGFYETSANKAAAQSFCDHYNKRDADGGGAPYTVQALYTEHQVIELLKRN